jgi:hypothetical protein
MKLKAIFAGLAVVIACACQPAPSAPAPAPAPSAAPIVEGEFTTTATIVSVEDRGFPLFRILARPSDNAAPLSLTLNAEEATLPKMDRTALVGQAVRLVYRVRSHNTLRDLRDGDLSLVFDEPAPAPDPRWLVASGTLSGALVPTGGDVPGKIEVVDAKGAKTPFEHFISPEIVALNGKPVTAYYVRDAANDVVSIALLQTAAAQSPPPTQ